MGTVIIGGGVIGLSIARELKKRGVGRIRVLDRGRVGREASWAAAGILAPQVEADDDGEFFRLCYESNRMYRAFADELLHETGVDVELDQSGTLYVGFAERDEGEFVRRYEWQRAAGLKIEKLAQAEIRSLEPDVSDSAACGLYFPDEGQVENRKLVEALAAFARNNGIEISEGVEATGVSIRKDRVAGVETPSGEIPAEMVVIATGAWASHIQLGGARLPLRVKPIRGQMICYKPELVNIRHVVYSRRGYLVPRTDGRLLAGATVEDVGFDAATTSEGRRTLEDVAAEIAPHLDQSEVTDHWAGLRPYADGGLPYIGPVNGVDGLFAAVGHFRNGILLTPITARLFADVFVGEKAVSLSLDR
jgi:glycine oxidase